MLTMTSARHGRRSRGQAGFSLIELMVAVAIFLAITGVVTSGLMQMTNAQRSASNRTEMHAAVRSATELLQQEIGQAGRVGLATPAELAAAVTAGTQTVGLEETINGTLTASVQSIFVGEQLTIDAGSAGTTPIAETVTVTAVSATNNTITATFTNAHALGAPVNAYGGFSSGIVPPSMTNGSTGSVLKLYGDINDDGKMEYVEYTCDTTDGYLYRNEMSYDASSKPTVTSDEILLSNLEANPNGTACFTYMPSPQPTVNGNTYVLDVAVTLTVQTELRDPITNQFQTETKALLNVSPRNVFNVWQLASAGFSDRVQPMPSTVTSLLP
jgi:prepilin-type N-terminal cleavage/methylation domain-containing protein